MRLDVGLDLVVQWYSSHDAGQTQNESHKLDTGMEVEPQRVPSPAVPCNNGANWQEHTPREQVERPMGPFQTFREGWRAWRAACKQPQFVCLFVSATRKNWWLGRQSRSAFVGCLSFVWALVLWFEKHSRSDHTGLHKHFAIVQMTMCSRSRGIYLSGFTKKNPNDFRPKLTEILLCHGLIFLS